MSKTKTSSTKRGAGSRWTGEQLFLLEKHWESYLTSEIVKMLWLTFGVERTAKTVTQCHYAYFGSGAKKIKPNLPQEYQDLKAGRKGLSVQVQWKAKREPKLQVVTTGSESHGIDSPAQRFLRALAPVKAVNDETSLVRVEGKVGTVSIKTKRSFQEILAFLVFLSKD